VESKAMTFPVASDMAGCETSTSCRLTGARALLVRSSF
jgi:hypothetical protein